MSALNPVLRIFAKLDASKLSTEFKETIGRAEGSFDAVDWDLARDLPWTEEIMEAQNGFLVVGEDGEVLVAVDTLPQAERVRSSAKVTFAIEVDEKA